MPTRMPPHAYADWKGCLRPRFFILGAYAGASAGFLLVVNMYSKYFPKQFTVGVLNAAVDLAALVLVGVAAFFGSEVVLAPFGSLHVGVGVGWCGRLLGRRSRCLRAASAEPPRVYAVEPRQIPRNHLS